jgi:phospho-N-acetylmuramoyl-pentapeptide-transferase
VIALLLAGGVSLIVALIGTPLLIRALQTRGIGQPIRDEGPQGHFVKAGTPTMGGLMILAGAVAGYAVGHIREGAIFTRGGLLVVFLMVSVGLIGFGDDWLKVTREHSSGLSRRVRVGAEIAAAAAFAVLALEHASANTMLSFTRHDSVGLDLGYWAWIGWAILIVLASTNAVNIADGLDGLAGGSAIFAFSAFAIIGFWQFRHFDIYGVPQALDFALLAIALTGACCGFLWWNAAPARIFMGDTGALALGAAMAGLALMMNVHLLLPIVAGLFVLIILSDVIQIASFRLFHKRVFRMAPLHHHFELAGWPETTVIVRFWILAGVCTAMALGTFYADFIAIGGVD